VRISISRFAILAIALVTTPAAAAPPESLNGTWEHTEIRTLESGRQSGGEDCLRIWLERRSYVFDSDGESAEGIYTNLLMAVPLGLMGANCRFAPPAVDALNSHTRSWQVTARRHGAAWEVSAHHPVSSGPLDLETPPFKTSVQLDGGRLVDQRDGDPLVFRRPASAPTAAREVLERDIERIHTGGCASVHRHLELAPGARERIDEICDLIARSRDFTGSYLGLEVQRTETFDAVPDVFPDPASQAWVDRPGVLFDYKLRFERQDLYGTAIVWQKEGAWRLAFVW